MAESIKDKFENAGHKIAEAATKAGHVVTENAEEASDWAKEKAHQVGNRIDEAKQKFEHQTGASLTPDAGATRSIGDIREHMGVYASCGTLVGKVDHVEGSQIKLTRRDSPDDLHHLIPTSWVSRVDDHVHLSKDHVAVREGWLPA